MALVRRSTAYVVASTALATAVTSYAFYDRPNFYSAAVHLSQSSACLIILSNAALVYFAGFMYGLQLLLFGSLRPIEIEQLWERGWIAGTEWLFALSIFRDDFGVAYMMSFILLFVSKLWGWLVVGRLDILEQQNPANATKFHARLLAATVINIILPFQMASYCFDEAMYGPKSGIMTMFTFEFGILFIGAVSTTLRYGLWFYEYRLIQKQLKGRMDEMRREAAETDNTTLPTEDVDVQDLDLPGWEAKGSFQFALDIGTDFLKLAAYLTFFGVLTVLYGLPIYIVRDLYMTASSFFNRVNDYRQYRNATRNMHNQYPDASVEDLASDPTCIICREDMKPWIGTLPSAEQAANRDSGSYSVSERHRPKKLPCGHILHFSCLRSWLERQQACPTCRRSVLRPLVVPGIPQQPPVNGVPREPVQPGQPGIGNAGPRPIARPHRNQRPAGWGFRLGPFRFFFGRLEGNQAAQQHIRNIIADAANQQRHGQANGALPLPLVPDASASTNRDHRANGGANPDVASTNHPLLESNPIERFSRSLQTHSLHAHLTAIEHMIAQDVQSLNIAEQRIQTIHWLLAEVERTRSEVAVLQRAMQPIQLTSRMQTEQSNSASSSSDAASQVILDNQGNMLATLPHGWTVIPFQQVPHAGEASSPAARPTQGTSAERSSTSGSSNSNGEEVQSQTQGGLGSIGVLQPTPTQSLPLHLTSQHHSDIRTPSTSSLTQFAPRQDGRDATSGGSVEIASGSSSNSRHQSLSTSGANITSPASTTPAATAQNGTRKDIPNIFNEPSWSFSSLPATSSSASNDSHAAPDVQQNPESKTTSKQPSVEDEENDID